jgi:hypothetical protein
MHRNKIVTESVLNFADTKKARNNFQNSYTAISLFCGAGGCSAGFQRAGYNILLASDIDRAAISSYKVNFPHTNCLESDICNIDFQKTLHDWLYQTCYGRIPQNLAFIVGKIQLSLLGALPGQDLSYVL